MRADTELLRCYAEDRAEKAFAELVRRHIDLVYAVALRRVGGDVHLAQDVSQCVFVDLARKAGTLARHPALTAWLFRSTRFAAAQAMRAKLRRHAREQEAGTMHELIHEHQSEPDWERLRSVMDDAIEELPDRDRIPMLWRFYEGRAFAEIGKRLSVSEDAARMRVDRGLDKLRARFERRGITSTSIALSAALANQVMCAKPVGLAASVTASALAGAATSGTAAGAAAEAAIGFMGTTKLSSTVAVAVLLLASLAGNGYLALRTTHVRAAALSVESAPPALAQVPTAPPTPVSLVKHADLALLRDRMRVAGASDVAIRAVLEGILRQRYREKLSAQNATRLQHWWRDDQRTWGTAKDTQLPFPDLRLMHEMIDKPLETLLGIDPLDEAEAEARYAFLPLELRVAFGRLDRASVGGFSGTGEPDVDAKIRKDFFEQRQLLDEERKALVASLTPEQRLDHDMRLGQFAAGLRRQLEHVAVAEQEFRSVFPIAERYTKAFAALPSRDHPDTAKHELDHEFSQQLIRALGYERALDYIWAGTFEYPAVARVAREANLPPTTAGHVLQLAAETANGAMAVHDDALKSTDQKRVALLDLQQAARAQLETLLPGTTQQRLAPTALGWLSALGEGRYKIIMTTMPGHVRAMVGAPTLSVDAPIAASPSVRQFVPQRPAGN